MRTLYDIYSKDGGFIGPKRGIDLEPTDNSALEWDDNEKRALPKNMLLHESIEWFNSLPRNSIKGYRFQP